MGKALLNAHLECVVTAESGGIACRHAGELRIWLQQLTLRNRASSEARRTGNGDAGERVGDGLAECCVDVDLSRGARRICAQVAVGKGIEVARDTDVLAGAADIRSEE